MYLCEALSVWWALSEALKARGCPNTEVVPLQMLLTILESMTGP